MRQTVKNVSVRKILFHGEDYLGDDDRSYVETLSPYHQPVKPPKLL